MQTGAWGEFFSLNTPFYSRRLVETLNGKTAAACGVLPKLNSNYCESVINTSKTLRAAYKKCVYNMVLKMKTST